ncbi:DUF3300 domain-containing protein [Pseudomonas sp. GV071]|uniref:DUF3300 domain-containing protein n=1 Tax=Pseudomonas sp. GV071 TaxID=2135754 RepID=UPI000D351166|nr:DUF3300 domain-containing protein [Pseudomonas sp. GV071]PTQ70578.1 uncharacterized protein DUF3300 [Pseudomonas sp. GV071]
MHVLRGIPMWSLLLILTAVPFAIRAAEPAAPAATEQVFSVEELDQMLAPLALYPDALLAQVLMAATYPGDVADAAAWSKANPKATGDDAVRQVASQPWDPSVQSLVAFPAVLVTLGQDPAWVQRVGDAFLAKPDAVMDSVQRLRRQAKEAGNLSSNDKQKVSEKPATTATSSSTQTIIIESADPQVIYVPSYNPTVVYGTWPYPTYPPVYYPPPPGYYLGSAVAAGIGFAVGVAVIDSIWGDCNWDNGDIDIDVNRYNTINDNRQLNVQDKTWKHNPTHRDGVPYRDRTSREQYGQRLANGDQREALRGRDTAAERDRARQSLEKRGFDSPASTNKQARERAQAADRNMRTTDHSQRREQPREQPRAASRSTRDNAFAGARAPDRERANQQRGQASQAAARRPQSARSGGQAVSRPAASSNRGGARRR